MKECRDCGLTLPLDRFYRNDHCLQGVLSWCKPCSGKRYAKGRAERARRDRLYFQQIKLDRGCLDCGYRANPVALDFDHRPETVKLYRVCTMAGMRRDLLDAEIAKCDVRCANCHRIKTAERLGALPPGE